MKNSIFILEHDLDALCKMIRNSPTDFRILLKTKNEEYLIERWINHYVKIINDKSSILIFDNSSTRNSVFDIYKQYEDKITLIKYSCHFNYIHSPQIFPDLYKAIWDSSKFYLFIDTDEFLYLYDEEKVIKDSRITSLLQQSPEVKFFPTFWFKNAYFKENVFSFRASREYMRYLIAMGKPIINSAKLRDKIQNPMAHALQMPISVYGVSPACFLLLHLNTLSKEQRIRVNMDKLMQYGIIEHSYDFFTVLNIDIDKIANENAKYFIKEIRHLISSPDNYDDTIGPGHIEMLHDETLKFYPDESKHIFQRYVNKNVSFFDLLGFTPVPGMDRNTLIWEIFDKESYAHKIPPQNKWEF